MLVDSHCHLDLIEDEGVALSDVMQQAQAQGITHLLTVSTRLSGVPRLLRYTEQYAQVTTSVGLHPNEHEDVEPSVETLVSMAAPEKVVAIGETGLDYFRSEGDLAWQRDRFRVHIEAAKQLQKPLIIHSRQAKEDTLAVLKDTKASEVGGVMHCFSEDWATAQAAMELGFYISFSGVVTFKNAQDLRSVAKRVPLDRLLVETDAPYLAPMPHRGQRNQPAFVAHTAQLLADVRETSLADIARATTDNFQRLFGVTV
jgi:TatD DNase family protein